MYFTYLASPITPLAVTIAVVNDEKIYTSPPKFYMAIYIERLFKFLLKYSWKCPLSKQFQTDRS